MVVMIDYNFIMVYYYVRMGNNVIIVGEIN